MAEALERIHHDAADPPTLRAQHLVAVAPDARELVGLLVELRLPNFKDLPYDPSVVDGGIVLAVACAEGARGSVETAVGAAGASKVNWV